MVSKFIPILIAVVLPLAGWASTELPAQYDGRSMALGGAGAGYLDDGAALAFNPASLEQMETFVATLDVSLFIPRATAPFPAMTGGVEQIDSARSAFPLFFLGAAYRLWDDMPVKPILAAAVYPTAGFGAKFEDIEIYGGESIEQTITSLEFHTPIILTIIDGLAVSVGWRGTFTLNQMVAHDFMMGKIESEMSGWNFKGLSAGLFFQPIDMLRFSFVFRNKIDLISEGTTEMNAPPPAPAGERATFDTRSEFAAPHTFRFGTAVSLLNKKLMLALDLKFALYKPVAETMTIRTFLPDGTELPPQEMKMNWKNVLAVHLGVEYALLPLLDLRAGYSLSNSATPKTNAQPFLTPPGLLHGIHLGTGLHLVYFDINFGGYWSFGGEEVEDNAETGVLGGEYATNSFMFGLSGVFHF